MKRITITLIIVLSMILMTGVFSRVTIFGVQPDIMLVCMIGILCLDNSAFVLPIVGICMFVVDSMFARAIGFYTIPYLIVGVGVYIAINKFNRKNWLVVFALMALGWILKEIVSCGLALFLQYPFSITGRITGIILPGILITLLVAAVVFPLLYILFGRAYMVKDANYDLNTLK